MVVTSAIAGPATGMRDNWAAANPDKRNDRDISRLREDVGKVFLADIITHVRLLEVGVIVEMPEMVREIEVITPNVR